MSYNSEVLADSPLWFAELGDSGVVNATTATASSAHAVGPASNAINGTVIGSWITNGVVAGWLRLQFASAVTLTAYQVCGPETASGVNRAPKDWTFEGSNDGTTFTTLDTRTSQTSWASNETRAYTFSNTTAYLYYRINITANNGDASFTQIAELICGNGIADSSGNSRIGAFSMSGTTFGTTGLVNGDSTTAATFDGTDDRIRFISYQSWMAPTAVTVEAVIKTSATTGTRSILDRDDQSPRASQFRLNAGKLEFVTIGGGAGTVTASDTTNIADGVRHHVAATYDASNIKLYVDGTLVKTQAASGALSTSQAKWSIGANFSGSETGAAFFNGVVHKAAIYGTALSGARIAAHAAQVTASTATGVVAATLPSLTASLAGTVTDLGSIAATLPSLTASLAGTVDNTVSGTVAATLPSLTSSLAGLVTIPAAVAATLPSLTASITGTDPLPSNSIDVTLPSLTAAIAGTSTPDVVEIAMDLHGGGTLDIADLIKVTVTSMQMHGAGRVNMRLPRDWDADQRTGRPQWKFVLADMPTLGGALKCQLEVVSDEIDESLDEVTSGAFEVRNRDPKRALIEPVVTWLHVYRGKHHMGGGPILPNPSVNGATTTYQWRDPRWLLDGDFRPIKQIPRRDLLRNPSFDQGLLYWVGGWDTGTIPAAKPIVSIVESEFEPGGKSLEIRGADKTQLITSEVSTASVFVPNSATYLAGGEAQIQAVGNAIPNGSTVQIIGHTANDGTGSGLTLSLNRALAAKATLLAQDPTLTFVLPSSLWPHDVTGGNVVGRGYYQPIASNSTESGMAQNRRVTISYEGTQTALSSAQWEKQTVRVTAVPQRKVRLSPVGEFKISEWIGPNLPGLAAKVTVVKVGETAPIEGGTAEVEMTEETPRDRLVSTSELEGNLEVEIPAGSAQYDVTLYLYAPAGAIHWEEAHLYPDDGLFFYDTDQALIVKGLVDNAQDVAKGWAPLGFSTRTPLTGVKRKREYYYSMQRPTSVALTEFTALDRGMNISCEVAPAGATIVTHYPRQGTTSDLVLAHGYNVIAWEPASSRDVASLIIAQADGNGIARPEKYAIDDNALGGLRLGGIVNAENETPLNELDEFAVRELARAKITTPAYWVTIHPRHVSDFYDRAGMGDSLRVALPAFDGAVRLVKRRPDPNTDGCRAMVAVEV